MRWTPKLLSCAFVFLLASFSALPAQTKAKEKGQPQMVWVNYAEGQVKFSPGHKGEPMLGKDWYEANAGQVVENGYTLVTEKGRAEIEFEDGSVVYLAENSALEFDWLWVREEETETNLSLLTGTATISHATKNELTLQTPSMWMTSRDIQTLRLDGALDGTLLTPIAGSLEIKTREGTVAIGTGESGVYYKGRMIPLDARDPYTSDEDWNRWTNATVSKNRMSAPAPGDEWDAWVEGRIKRRQQLVAQGMKESGLTEPIPGLAGMVESGRFFDCAADGKCWQSNAVERSGGEPLNGAVASGAGSPESLRTSGMTQEEGILVNQTMMQRCPLEAWQVTENPQGRDNGNTVQYGPCLTGTWNASPVNPRDRCWRWDLTTQQWVYWPGCDVYTTWVAGHGRHHHHRECHFVKTGKHGIGIVPRNARDQKGNPPVNLKSGILVLTAEKGRLQASAERAPDKGVTLLENAPRDLGKDLLGSAPRVAQPVIEARMTVALLPKGIVGVGHIAPQKNVSVARLDYRSGNFVGRTTDAVGGGHSVVVAHAGGGGSAGGGAHGGSSGGGGGGASSGSGHSGGAGGSSGGSGGGAGAGGGGHH